MVEDGVCQEVADLLHPPSRELRLRLVALALHIDPPDRLHWTEGSFLDLFVRVDSPRPEHLGRPFLIDRRRHPRPDAQARFHQYRVVHKHLRPKGLASVPSRLAGLVCFKVEHGGPGPRHPLARASHPAKAKDQVQRQEAPACLLGPGPLRGAGRPERSPSLLAQALPELVPVQAFGLRPGEALRWIGQLPREEVHRLGFQPE